MRGSVTTESLSREVHDAAEAYGFEPRANTGLEVAGLLVAGFTGFL